MPGLDNMEPGMDQQEPAQNDVIGTHGEADREGAMAKADLFKLANYSHKLYQQINDEDQLEAWVQAKITKAADYIASVYHYLEYEMKFSEYGHHLDNSDTLSESQKNVLKARLMEAKDKMKELKKTQAEKVKEKKVDEGVMRGGEQECAECGGTGMVTIPGIEPSERARRLADKHATHIKGIKAALNRETAVDEETSSTGGTITRTKTGLRHSHNPARFSDEPHAEPASKVKARSAADKAGEKAQDKADEKESKAWGKANPGKQTIMKGGVKTTNEAKKAAKDYDGDGKIESGKDEYLGSRIRAAKKAGKLKEAAPRGQRSQDSAIKVAQIGKSKSPGANLKQGAEDALEKGNHKKIDQIHQYATTTTPTGRAKKVSEAKPSAGLSKAEKSATVKKAKAGKDIGKPGKSFKDVAKKAGGGEKGKKIAAAAMWKNIKETTAYMAEKKAVKDLPGNQEKIDADHDGKIEKSDLAALRSGKKAKETVKESTDFTRMQEQLARLNRAEKPALVENREVDQIRALTKRLLG